jgi:hypothetical protein
MWQYIAQKRNVDCNSLIVPTDVGYTTFVNKSLIHNLVFSALPNQFVELIAPFVFLYFLLVFFPSLWSSSFFFAFFAFLKISLASASSYFPLQQTF